MIKLINNASEMKNMTEESEDDCVLSRMWHKINGLSSQNMFSLINYSGYACLYLIVTLPNLINLMRLVILLQNK